MKILKCALMMGWIVAAAACLAEKARPDLTGRVADATGSAIGKATVFIYTAGPKEGTSSMCPSCYPDCVKRAQTGADGRFTISSLDPKLLFRLLAVAPGRVPTFMTKTDPAKGPVEIVMPPFRIEDNKNRYEVNGMVIDDYGKAVAGATIGAYGADVGEGSQWGGTDAFIDPLAVTDEKGRFMLTCAKKVKMIHAVAAARGAAQQWVDLNPGGDYLVILHEGAMITGRVMRQGQPVPNVIVAADTTERICGEYYDCDGVPTDKDGRFRLSNVPADREYHLFGTMEPLRGIGVLPIRTITSAKSGATQDVGTLEVVPGHIVKGRLALSDGKEIPAGTRFTLARRDVGDVMQVVVGANGRFEFKDVPAESVGLSVRIKGYRFSKRNPSLDWLNGEILGRVDKDITDLTLLMEPGEWQFNRRAEDQPANPQPRDEPLRGVTGKEFAGR